MSRNVAIVKAAIDAYNRQQWDAMFQDVAPDFEFDLSRAMGDWRGFYGVDQHRRFLTEFADHWESVRIEPHEFIEAGDLVIVPQTMHMKGRDGIEVVARVAFVWTIREGRITHLCFYQERQDALEAAGLPSDAPAECP